MTLNEFKRDFQAALKPTVQALMDGKLELLDAKPERVPKEWAGLPTSSQIGKCRRMVTYAKQGHKPMDYTEEDVLWIEFAVHSHKIIQTVLDEAFSELYLCEWEKRVAKKDSCKWLYSGAYDFLINSPEESVLVEIKNCTPSKYKSIRVLDDLFEYNPEYRSQVQSTMASLPLVKKTFFILRMIPEYKSTCNNFKFFELEKDPNWLEKAKKGWFDELMPYLERGELFPPEYSKAEPKSKCRYCAFQHLCDGKQLKEDTKNETG